MPIHAQEVPEFGSSTGSAIEVDANRVAIREPEESAPGNEGEAIVVTAARRLTAQRVWKWKFIPAAVSASDRSTVGVESRAAYAANEFSFRYTNVDPDGLKGPYDQFRARVKHAFPQLKNKWIVEAQGQFTRQTESYREPSVSSNLTIPLPAASSLSFSAGWAWRDRDEKARVDDFDASVGLKHTFSNKMAVGLNYRMRNDISGEDDFGVGVDVTERLKVLVGKHWVSTVSYVYALKTNR